MANPQFVNSLRDATVLYQLMGGLTIFALSSLAILLMIHRILEDFRRFH
ncbi:MAG: hypothetical protein KDD73_05640 [Anaerolineales bacterium]|nr:hypothetical protein [Anaerolineales bacterium]MCB9126325.1 hypothetical protein [Ardenticatenales bacterium]MCB9171291.1 hypothetical protein [Ardenticatenales bacterium]